MNYTPSGLYKWSENDKKRDTITQMALNAEKIDTAQVSVAAQLADIAINVKQYGAVGDGVTDDTLAFKAAAALGKPLMVPLSGSFYKISETIELSNSIVGSGMPEIRMEQDGSESKRMFVINDYQGEGLIIQGLMLNGGYVSGTAGEQSHLIRIGHSSNIQIKDNYLKGAYGDCVYVGSVHSATNRGISENIHIRDNVMDNPRRCAVALVYARNVWIKNNVIRDEQGYVATIDIEPNDNGDEEYVEDVSIENNVFYSTTYFVKLYNPNTKHIKRIVMKGNRGESHYMFHAATGLVKDVTINDNEFYGSVGDARMILMSACESGLMVSGNKDFSKGANGWRIGNCLNPKVLNNYIESSRTIGVLFDNCNSIDFIGNTIKDVYSSSGSLGIQGSIATSNHNIVNNTFINSDYAIRFQNAASNKVLIQGNKIESARRGISVEATAIGSSIKITTDNTFTGAGVPINGGGNAGNQGIGYKTNISLAPTFIGEIAVNSGVVYTAVGTSSVSDWVRSGRYVSVPTSATSSGSVGDWSADGGYLYICHATNTWKRVAIATW